MAALVNWMARRQGWTVAPEWITVTPGVVVALNALVRTFVAPGEKVLIQPPVYPPFFTAITNNGIEIAHNPLTYEQGRYTMDFAGMETLVRDPAVTMAILCNPHNPIGRVWTRDELQRFGELCLENGVLVVADEIHGDLIYPGQVFTPFASLGDAIRGKHDRLHGAEQDLQPGRFGDLKHHHPQCRTPHPLRANVADCRVVWR